jgi:glycosyltransferase
VLVSIITPTYNSDKTIIDTLESIESQTYKNIEHIIIDGLSKDSTAQIVKEFKSESTIRKFISMADDGIYDAMNKGIAHSSGDIICILNSDDFYKNEDVLKGVVSLFRDESIDFVYSDAETINSNLETIRLYKVGNIDKQISQIPHPCLWVRRKHVLKLIPPFDIKYSIAADLKFQLKLIHELKLKHAYLPSISTRIRIGGYSNSSILSVFEGWKQSYNVVDDVLGRGAFIYTLKKVIKNTTGFFTAKL